jgi:glycosyltransferase involved in cell wall biosynthesis
MRVLFLSSNISSTGGIQKYSTQFIQALQKSGVVVTVVDRDPARLKFGFALRAIGAILFERPAYIVCGHLRYSPLCLFLYRIFGVPYVVVTHGIEAWNLKGILLRAALASARTVVTVSRFTQDRLTEQIPKIAARIYLLPDTIDGNEFYPKQRSPELLARHGLLPSDRVILTVCRLSASEQYKGYDTVIEAMPEILAAVPNARYLIVGKGDDVGRIKQLIAERHLERVVTLCGYVAAEDLIDYYNLCDVFVMPSTGEGFGIVFLEALACGKPVIAGNLDASQEAVLGGRLGLLVNPHSAPEIAGAAIRVLSSLQGTPLFDPDFLRREALKSFGIPRFRERIAHLAALVGTPHSQEAGRRYRVAVILSYPIHYHVAFCRELASNPAIDLLVYFCSDFGLRPGYDETFEQTVTWYDERMLKGFRSKLLPRWFKRESCPGGFWSVTNPRIIPELLCGRYDAVIIHGYTHCTNWLAVVAAKLAGSAVLLRGESNLLSVRPGTVRAAKKAALAVLFPMVDAFLPIGTLNTAFYEHYGVRRERMFLTPYTVDNATFQSERERLLPDRGQIRRTLGIPPDTPVILFMSKLIERKRPMDLLLAFEKLVAGNRAVNPSLIFVGDGPERAALERYTQEHGLKRVTFVGFKRPDETAPYFVAADIFAFPSGFETWGLVVNEAMNFKLPVITTNMVGSSYDLVRDGETGYIHSVGDVGTLVERLATLCTDALLRESMGMRSFNHIGSWSNREAADGVLRALRSL